MRRVCWSLSDRGSSATFLLLILRMQTCEQLKNGFALLFLVQRPCGCIGNVGKVLEVRTHTPSVHQRTRYLESGEFEISTDPNEVLSLLPESTDSALRVRASAGGVSKPLP